MSFKKILGRVVLSGSLLLGGEASADGSDYSAKSEECSVPPKVGHYTVSGSTLAGDFGNIILNYKKGLTDADFSLDWYGNPQLPKDTEIGVNVVDSDGDNKADVIRFRRKFNQTDLPNRTLKIVSRNNNDNKYKEIFNSADIIFNYLQTTVPCNNTFTGNHEEKTLQVGKKHPKEVFSFLSDTDLH